MAYTCTPDSNYSPPPHAFKRMSWNSVASLSMTPAVPTTSNSLFTLPDSVPSMLASEHDRLMYDSAAEISFEIQDIIEIVHEPPIPNSIMPPITEAQIKIVDEGRLSPIPAAEMTSSMQAKLRSLTVQELRDEYRVTRSNEAGSRGLYTLTKPEWAKSRPKSLQLGALASPFSALRTPKSALSSATRNLFGLLTPMNTPNGDTDFY